MREQQKAIILEDLVISLDDDEVPWPPLPGFTTRRFFNRREIPYPILAKGS
jgi:hypothetical protein